MAFELPCSFCFDEKHVLTRLALRDVKHDPCVREGELGVFGLPPPEHDTIVCLFISNTFPEHSSSPEGCLLVLDYR